MGTQIEIENNAGLDRLLLTGGSKMEKEVIKLIKKVIKDARKELVASAATGLGMKSDTRGAAYSIRRSVYKRILGGQVNILGHRKAGRPTTYEPKRTLQEGQRGGNRVPRGRNTERMMSYGPHDRQMVLMWLNGGTGTRTAGTRGGRLHGNRGSITARNWFGLRSYSALDAGSEKLAIMIEQLIKEEMQ